MDDREFYSLQPIGGYIFSEDKIEHHIHLHNASSRARAFYDNTQSHLWEVVCEHLKTKYKDEISSMGSDISTSNSTYIWIHVRFTNHKQCLSEILDDLDNFFKTNISPHLVPKLVSIITRKLSISLSFFANAICEHQGKYGKDNTKHALETFFRDIRPSYYFQQNNI